MRLRVTGQGQRPRTAPPQTEGLPLYQHHESGAVHHTFRFQKRVNRRWKHIKSRENKARKDLANLGYALQKRTNTADPYHNGSYRILNGFTGNIEAGENFDLTMEDVEKFINE